MATTPSYYYPTRPRQGLFRAATPMYTYTSVNASTPYVSTNQTYYSPVRRRWPFGLFQRRYRQVAAPTTYTTTAYAAPGYYSSPAVTPTYAPTTYTAPVGAVPSTATTTATPASTATTYTPTTYDVPTGTSPAVTAPARAVPSVTSAPANHPLVRGGRPASGRWDERVHRGFP